MKLANFIAHWNKPCFFSKKALNQKCFLQDGLNQFFCKKKRRKEVESRGEGMGGEGEMKNSHFGLILQLE